MSAPTSPQPIELIFKYSHKTFTIETTQEATLGELRQLLHKQTEVAPALQKIMFKGKALSNDSTKLTEFKLRNKEKLLLVGSSIQEVLKVAEQSEQTTETSKDDEKVYLSDLPQHKKIIEKGVPEEAIKGFRNRHVRIRYGSMKRI
eukprot:TRINITY_DN1327_c0_g2_i1.p1 TRINITY_DN1327_c0_g2~~TRINITY_DN1327_c0_g2_i1.p1  ORF type:complete len:146 (+),score=19.83 TRINITY_DN1327_c0_g2_i1:86-523(+)